MSTLTTLVTTVTTTTTVTAAAATSTTTSTVVSTAASITITTAASITITTAAAAATCTSLNRTFIRTGDVSSLGTAIRSGLNDELHRLTVAEAAETVGSNGRLVNEELFTAVFRRDETEAFGVVEPLDGAGLSGHFWVLE
ncbi:hypothetical protein Hanom_Chr17g01545691 [Helianthus anomalus]